jgi:hypothetical protein
MIPRKNILESLEGGDRRSIGLADEVAERVLRNTKLFRGLMAGLWSENPVVRMRAADAVEKITRVKPALLQRYKRELLGLLSSAEEPEMQWHLAAMVPRLQLTTRERTRAFACLNQYLDSRSSIAKTFALQALADLARNDDRARPEVVELLREATRSGTAAMKARSRKLLKQLEQA